MWVRTNPNPKHKHVPDCVIRALAIVLNKTWYQVYDDLYLLGRWDVERSVPGLLAKRIRSALLALIRTAGAVFTCGSGFFLPERSTEGSKQL